MTAPSDHGLSKRGWSNVEAIMPKIKGAVEQRKISNNTNIDLSTAENWLIRPELIEICKEAIIQNIEARHLSYPRGFSGDPDLLAAYAHIFNTYFNPHIPVLPSHLVTAPGAASCIDALLYNICEAGDGILLPGPYWNGFDFSMRVRSAVNPVVVPLLSLSDNFTEKLISALEKTRAEAECPIKALMVTNPHNPLGVSYPSEILEMCLQFCKKYSIHFISDEVYALSVFESSDLPMPKPFVSALSLDLDRIGADKSRVHVVWSTSKDFGQSGFRMGCTVTQFNEEMAVGLALAANTQISALSTIFVTSLLTSPKLTSLVALNRERLRAAYTTLTNFLKRYDIPYLPCNAGLYVFARLAHHAVTWEDEAEMVEKLKDAGLLVSAGRAYHVPESEKGWMRIGFSVEQADLVEAIRRMESVVG
ncbi:1-aminocyclopropane-1-carboxylate synthase [Melanomma pulvis-pyrius CBS 109.77]|uniref:1-aminocyclopropane-1-carboxylate synthase n=1 Tax=Melanomma pulvis-pyrius CBS 109.77 TaxID=1314802 RepID=A0A6A6XGT6_9PLEO|nr:1-aminocyclopropane-1-carboxylate synthase [Melanomma pulvis-pyrius CBS 109.77]